MVAILLAAVLVSGCLSGETRQWGESEPERPENSSDVSNVVEEVSQNALEAPLVFTHEIFDPDFASHITPLGELNGGYSEAQTIGGVMVNLKPEAYANNNEIEVRAPTDMILERYAYWSSGGEKGWVLHFRVSPDVVLKYDHITRASDGVMDATTRTPSSDSRDQFLTKPLAVKAGEVVAYTSGTSLAHNWNIYLTDATQENNFANRERLTKDEAGRRLLTARCPFDFYPEDLKREYMDLMGYSRAGQSQTCGTASRDVSGTLSGMWHFSPDAETGLREELDGIYASPLSVFRNSAGETVVHQVDNRRLDIQADEPTNKDPAKITSEHCYRTDGGYAFFKVVSATEMKFAYSDSGSCPSALPASSKTYYR